MVKKKALRKCIGTDENLILCSNTLSDCRVDLNRELDSQESITLNFNLHFQDNSLSYDDSKESELNKRQIAIYKLICFMKYEKKMSWRRISSWLNRSGIKTHKGKKWSETGSSVHSVIKRMNQREERLNNMKYKTQSEISNFQIQSGNN